MALALCLIASAGQASPRAEAAARLHAAEATRAAQALAAARAARDLQAARAQEALLADQRAQAAADLRRVEAGVLDAAARLSAASEAQAVAESALARRQAAFAGLIPLMLRLRTYPAETVLAVPATPYAALEGLLVTRGLAISLNREAADLRARQDEAAGLRRATAAQAAVLAAERDSQARRGAALDRVVERARGQVSQAEAAGQDAARMIQAAAAQARTLRGAIAAMDAAQAQAEARAAREAALALRQRKPRDAVDARARQAALARPAGPALAQAVGRLVPPAAGSVQRAFGAASEDGPATGITFATAPAAFVSSPCAGRVAFAAPFRSYGQLVILECGGGYDVVLAGLGRIDARPGHAMRPGEPVGRMPDTPARPSLYVELRSGGQPVDPAPFLRGKV